MAIGNENGMNVHHCLRKENGSWSEPILLKNEINSTSYEFSCHPSNLGSMFVCSWRAGEVGGCDSWRIPVANAKYQTYNIQSGR